MWKVLHLEFGESDLKMTKVIGMMESDMTSKKEYLIF